MRGRRNPGNQMAAVMQNTFGNYRPVIDIDGHDIRVKFNAVPRRMESVFLRAASFDFFQTSQGALQLSRIQFRQQY